MEGSTQRNIVITGWAGTEEEKKEIALKFQRDSGLRLVIIDDILRERFKGEVQRDGEKELKERNGNILGAYIQMHDSKGESGQELFAKAQHEEIAKYFGGAPNTESVIILTGGGIVENNETAELMKNNQAIVIHFDLTFDKFIEYLKRNPRRLCRPQGETDEQTYTRRTFLYKSIATITIPLIKDGKPRTIDDMYAEVTVRLKQFGIELNRPMQLRTPSSPMGMQGLS